MTPTAARWARWELPAVLAVALLSLVLRLHDFTRAPLPSDNQDEVDWAWGGLGIITRGVPYGWSNLQAYVDRIPVTANGTTFQVAHPFLDHPPLFSLLVGGVAWLRGARQLGDITVDLVRPVPIALSVAALVLLYLLARGLVGRAPALLGVLLLATSPAAVLVQRQVEAESLLAPLLLLALLATHRVLVGAPHARWVTILLGCCALAPLAKVSGVAVAGAVVAVLLGAGRFRLAAAALGSGVLGLAAYFAYGIAYDSSLFFRVLAESETHRYGVMGVYEFVAAPAGPSGAVRHLRDGWWLLGWLGAGTLAGRARHLREEILLWPLVAYAVVIMLAAEGIQDYGWFRVAVYPLVYLLAGWLAYLAISRPSAIALLAVITLGGATATTALFARGSTGWKPSAYVLLLGLVVAVAPSVLSAWRTDRPGLRHVAQGMAAVAVAVILAAAVASSWQLEQVYFGL